MILVNPILRETVKYPKGLPSIQVLTLARLDSRMPAGLEEGSGLVQGMEAELTRPGQLARALEPMWCQHACSDNFGSRP